MFGFLCWHEGGDGGEMFKQSWPYNACSGCFMQFVQRKQCKGGRMQGQVFHSPFPLSALFQLAQLIFLLQTLIVQRLDVSFQDALQIS